MKPIFYLLIPFSLFFLPGKPFSQCGIPSAQFQSYLSEVGWNLPLFSSEIAVLKNPGNGGASELIEIVQAGETYPVEVISGETTSLVFATVCRSALITSGNVGSICSETFECPDDLHFYSIPTGISSTANVTIELEEYFGGSPKITLNITIIPCTPEIPVLAEPQDDQLLADVNTVLRWEGETEGVTYRVQLDTMQDFSTPVIDQVVAGVTEFEASNLDTSQIYYWRVKAKTECDSSEWSMERSFTTLVIVDLFQNLEIEEELDLFTSLVAQQAPFEVEVAADGTYSLALEYEIGTLEIRTPGPSGEVGSLNFSYTPSSTIAEYTAPKEYDPMNNTVYLDFFHKGGISSPDISVKITIRPVPVVLLHGLGSSSEIWQDLKANLTMDGWEEGRILTPDYDNDISFVASAGSIAADIAPWVENMRSGGLFMNKIDMAGHSMGGLVARQFAVNGNGNRVNKIITLNTPHSGSEWANFVMDTTSYFGLGRKLGELVFSFQDGFNIDGGAMNSLRVNSDEIHALNNNLNGDFFAHAVTSDYEICEYIVDTGAPPDDDFEKFSKQTKIVLRMAGRLLNFAYYSGLAACTFHMLVLPPPNDGIVRVISQDGGLGGGATKNYDGIFGTFHTQTTENSEIIENHIPALLKSDPGDGSFAIGFSPQEIDPPFGPAEPIQASRSIDSSVEIAVEGVMDNDTLYASIVPPISVIGNVEVAGIMVAYHYVELDTVLFDSILASTHVFEIPEMTSYEGYINIVALGTDGFGEFDYQGFTVFLSQSAPPLPEVPMLIFPENGLSSVSTEPVFTWQSTPATLYYHFQLSLDEDFTNIINDSDSLSNNSLEVAGLQYNTTYYWRVRASNPTGEGEWSTVWPFTTEMMTASRELETKFELKVYPNPAAGAIFFEFKSPVTNVFDLTVFDSFGRALITDKRDVVEGTNQLNLDLQRLPGGLFHFELKGEGLCLVGKFSKMQ